VITRRDFLNGALLGTGAALLQAPAPVWAQQPAYRIPAADWYGYGGIGDYAPSHGNTPELVARAHEVRDGVYDQPSITAIDTGEVFDFVIVGGGLAGLGAAFEFSKSRKPGQQCLVLENHPIFGGEAKRNEFEVNGELLIAPQGSNGFSIPLGTGGAYAEGDARYYEELNVPGQFTYQQASANAAHLRYPQDNYGYLYWLQHRSSVGYFFGDDPGSAAPRWILNPWEKKLEEMPFSETVKKELLTWRYTEDKPYQGADFERWLDGMSYQAFMENVMGLGAGVTRYIDPIAASAVGSSSGAISAYAAYAAMLPGVSSFYPAAVRDFNTFERHSFPGGNDGFARYFMKRIIPESITGENSFEEILNGSVNFSALDRAGQAVRMRLGSSVVRVEHEGPPGSAEFVLLTYSRGGKLYRIKARGVVMATGGWINKHVVRDLPEATRAAYATFHHAAVLVANVALNNWHFLHKLGITAARWEGGFGFTCNIRRPMTVGSYQPPLDPDRPIVLSFYAPFFYPGQPAQAQGILGRTELFSTSYSDYEQQIMAQMQRLFGSSGFDAKRDVAGLILNRWGHAYIIPEPGFFFGRDGKPAARDSIRQRHGRIAFGHSELHGNQHWGPAADEGRRAMQQVLELA
jgi:spermidine dehydrogenase